MLLEGSHFIHSPPNRVFELLNDPEVLSRCVPGVKSLVLDGTDSYKAQVEVAIGPVKGKFDEHIFNESGAIEFPIVMLSFPERLPDSINTPES